MTGENENENMEGMEDMKGIEEEFDVPTADDLDENGDIEMTQAAPGSFEDAMDNNSMNDPENDDLDEPFPKPKSKPPIMLIGAAGIFILLAGAGAYQAFGSKEPSGPPPGFANPAITAPAPKEPGLATATTNQPVSMAEKAKQTGFETPKPQRDINPGGLKAPQLGAGSPSPAPKMTQPVANTSGIVLDDKGISDLSEKMADSIATKLTQAMIDAHGEGGVSMGAGGTVNMSPVISQVDDLHVKADRILEILGDGDGDSAYADHVFDGIASRLSKMGNFSNSEPVIIDGKYEGRSRLPGFKVFKTSGDGTMSVVRTPTNRVNVYFVGERFYANGKRVKVTGVEKDGWVVLVDDKYFIDAKRDPVPYRSKAAKKTTAKAPAKSTTTKTAAVKTKTTEAKSEPAKTASAPSLKASGTNANKGKDGEAQIWWSSDDVELSEVKDCCSKPKPVTSYVAAENELKGWKVHAINNGQYLLRDTEAKWHSAYLGKNFLSYGKVEGVSANNELVIGNNTVELVGH